MTEGQFTRQSRNSLPRHQAHALNMGRSNENDVTYPLPVLGVGSTRLAGAWPQEHHNIMVLIQILSLTLYHIYPTKNESHNQTTTNSHLYIHNALIKMKQIDYISLYLY